MSVLDFYLVTKKELLSTGAIESILDTIGMKNKILCISSIKNWQWEDKCLISKKEILSCLSYGRIIIVKFVVENLNNTGMYIEKRRDKYIYSFWCNSNSETLFHVSCEEMLEILKGSSLYSRMKVALEKYCKDFHSIAFGEEAIYRYSDSVERMVEESHNIVFWLFKNDIQKIPKAKKIIEIPFLEACLYIM